MGAAALVLMGVIIAISESFRGPAGVDALFVLGGIGWLAGPLFFAQRTVRRAVIASAAIGAMLFASMFSLYLLLDFLPYVRRIGENPPPMFPDTLRWNHALPQLTGIALMGGCAGAAIGCVMGWVYVLAQWTWNW